MFLTNHSNTKQYCVLTDDDFIVYYKGILMLDLKTPSCFYCFLYFVSKGITAATKKRKVFLFYFPQL